MIVAEENQMSVAEQFHTLVFNINILVKTTPCSEIRLAFPKNSRKL